MPHLPPLLGFPALLIAVTGGASTVAAQLPSASPGSSYHLEATWNPAARAAGITPRWTRPCTDRVQVIDTDGGKTIGEVPGLEGGHGTALVPDENRGFATSGKSSTVIVFDLRTFQSARPDDARRLPAHRRVEHMPTPAPGRNRVRPEMVPGSFMVLKFLR